MSINMETLLALSKALRPAIAELVSDYQAATKALQSESRRNLDRETLQKLQYTQSRRHYELGALVPSARHLRTHLQQIGTGVRKTPIEDTAAALVGVLLGFAVTSDPLSEYHPIWAVPLDARLVSKLTHPLMCSRHLAPARMWMVEDPELLMFQALEGSNLGELRKAYLARVKLEVPEPTPQSKNEKLSAFLAIRDRLRALLTPEEYVVLREFSGKL
jgi:hypothetical protein